MKTSPTTCRGLLILGTTLAALALTSPARAQEPPTFSKSFTPSIIGVGSVSTLRFDIDNSGQAQPASGLSFADPLPAGVVIAAPTNAATTCTNGTVTAPEGGTSLTLSGGQVGAGGTCSVVVDVIGSSAGVHTNTSGELISSAGSSGTATANLNVNAALPSFTKAFSADTISVGGVSTLTFTIDNAGNEVAATNLTFSDTLPTGMVIANPANLSNNCGGAPTAAPGTNVLTFFSGSVGGGASCTISVDVTASIAGRLGNTSGVLTSNQGTSGKAAAVLVVERNFLTKTFVDDPVPPGGTVTLEFTLTNFDRDNPATGITFTDELDATLTGLVAVGLPLSNVCGAGSQITGTSLLTLIGGSLAPGASCTFDLTLQVPGGTASGAYPNTTSSVDATVGGIPVVGEPATDNLIVQPVPSLTKSFTDDPVASGGTVTLEFTIHNTDTTASATGLTFSDDLSAMLSGAVATGLPINDVCGAGSTVAGIVVISLVGGNLPADGSCTFDVTVQLPAGTPGGRFPNTTTAIAGTVADQPVIGPPASDDLVVVSAPQLTKSFLDDPVVPGGTVTLQFTLSYDENAPAGATGIIFSDDLDLTLPGLVAVGLPANDVCGAGSTISGTSLLTFSGGILAPGSSCTFDVTLQVPAGALSGTHTNTTSEVTATSLGLPVSSPAASDDLVVSGLLFSKSFTDDPVPAGATVTLEFTLDNTSSNAAANISFTDDLDATLPGLVAVGLPANDICGAGSQLSGTSLLTLTGGNLATGTSCTVSVTLQVPGAAAVGEYGNSTSPLSADIGGNPVVLGPASDTLAVVVPLSIAKTFVNSPVAPGGQATLRFTLTNTDPVRDATGLSFTDDLEAALTGLAAVGLPANDVCGAGSQVSGTSVLNFTGGSLAPASSCTFDVTVQVPPATPSGTVAVNTTDPLLGSVGAAPVTGNSATASLGIVAGTPAFSKSFLTSPTLRGGTVVLQFTIANTDPTVPLTSISFTDDLDAALPGLVAVDLPKSDVCGAGSQLIGTSVLTLAGGNLPGGASCTFTVSVQVPADAPLGTATNITSVLSAQAAGAAVSAPTASADFTVVFLEISKAFAAGSVPAGDTTSLTFTLVNPDSANAATGISFTDDLDTALTGLVAVGLPQSDVCGAGSQLTGTSLLSLAGGSLPPGGSCMFTVSVQVPISTSTGTYTNVTSALAAMVGGTAVQGDPAGAAQAVVDVRQAVIQIPTLDFVGLVLLAGLLLLLAVRRLRRARGAGGWQD